MTNFYPYYNNSVPGLIFNISRAYLKCGRNTNTRYVNEIDPTDRTSGKGKAWRGEDHMEPWCSVALRIASWATSVLSILAIFRKGEDHQTPRYPVALRIASWANILLPVLVMVITVSGSVIHNLFLKKPSLKEDKIEVDHSCHDRDILITSLQQLEISGYNRLLAKYVFENRSISLFGYDDTFGRTKNIDSNTLALVILSDGTKHPESQTLRKHDYCLYDNSACLVSEHDSRALLDGNTGQLSRAFLELLRHKSQPD